MKNKHWKLRNSDINSIVVVLLLLFETRFITADNYLGDAFSHEGCLILDLKQYLPNGKYYSFSNSANFPEYFLKNDKLYSQNDCSHPRNQNICFDSLNLLPYKSYLKGQTCLTFEKSHHTSNQKSLFEVRVSSNSYKLYISWNNHKINFAQIFHNFSRTSIYCRNIHNNAISLSENNKLYIKKRLIFRTVSLPIYCTIMSKDTTRQINLLIEFIRNKEILKRKRRFTQLAFGKSFYHVQVRENSPENTVIETLKVSGGSGSYTFSKIPDQKTDDKFEVDPSTGQVKLLKELDREGGTPIFSLDIVATDTNDKSQTATVSVSVTLTDVNDNAPKFDKEKYTRSIDEEQGKKYILTVRASDVDDGVNREITYTIMKESDEYVPFTIDPKSGAITNTDKLDREQNQFFLFKVKAEDQGIDPQPLSSFVFVNVTLNDINDNKPEFPKSLYYVTMPESTTVGTTILKLNATDADIGSNGDIIYNTNSEVALFQVNEATGEIMLRRSVDYDRFQRSSTFTVTALDQGKPPLYDQAEVKITIEDVNDNAPIFTRNEFKPSDPISEDIEIGKSVYKLSARDADSGINGEILYKLGDGIPSDFPFSLDEKSGEIKVTKTLDYEVVPVYKFNVIAIDGGTPAQKDTAAVILPIRNVNDNNPEFKNSTYSIDISENKQKGEPVITVEAIDPDQLSIQDFLYTIDEGNSDNCFHIEPYYGIVLLKCDLDYKTKNKYNLKLKVVDGDQKPGYANLIINVYDANNNAPVFTSEVITLRIKEDVDVGSVVGKVVATDDDSSENARVSYSFYGSSDSFSINPDNGTIITKKKLDRETENSFTLTISGTDHGKPSTKSGRTTVVITVEDINDNAPNFLEKSYKFQIDEDAKVGTLVGSVHAIDEDQDLNKEIRYYFKNKKEVSMFLINPESGTIRTSKLLDREEEASYSFEVAAFDQGIKPLNSSVLVTITLNDVQDSDPVFTQRIYNFTIDENSNVEVGRVRATLADTDFRASLFYSISKNSRYNMFLIDRSQGVIRPKRPLDFEEERAYQINVRVQTLRGRTDIAIVNIKVNDVNDHPPILEDFYIFLNVLNGNFYPIFRIPASDPDVSSKLIYSIESGNNHDFVNLSKDTGDLLLKKSIVNTASEIEIGFKVTDGKYTTKSTGRISISEVSNVMIKNSMSIVLRNATREDFLKTKVLHKFKMALAKAFNCDSKRIFILSIEDFVYSLTNDRSKEPKLEVSIAVRVEEKDAYMTSEELKNKLYFSKKQFEKEFGLAIYTFDFSNEILCGSESCKNYQTCSFQSASRSNHTTIESMYVTFRGISIQSSLKCHCKIDQYRNGPNHGEVCGKSYNQCYKQTCGKFGDCVSTDNGYACICHPSYFGKHCEINKEESICLNSNGPVSLSESPCGQNGACVLKREKGFECRCHPNVETDTDFCTLSTRYFPRTSFIAVKGLKQRWNLNIQLEFRTTEANAVLLYNSRFTNKNDFIVIEVVGGQLVCSLSFGHYQKEADIVTSVGGFIPGGVDDGLWHTVKVQLKDRKLSIAAGALCDLDTAEKLNPEGKKKYCAASKYVDSRMKSLDLTAPMIIGGMPDVQRKFLSQSNDFIGCIRHVTIDHVEIDLSDVLLNKGSLARCPLSEDGKCQTTQPVLTKPCKNGICTNVTLTGEECECAHQYTGKQCEKRTNVVTLTKESEMFVSRSQSTGSGLGAWSYSLSIKTTALNAILLEESVNTKTGYLKISNGYVVYSIEPSTVLNLTSVYVSNSKWHRVKLQWKNNQLSLSAGYMDNHIVTKQFWFSSIQVGLSRFSGGGDNAFVGCIKDFVYSGNQVDLLLPQNKNVRKDCIENDLCAKKDCGENGYCDSKYGIATCVCNKAGYKGPNCVSVCKGNPCNKGNCIETSKTLSGFVCECPVNYTGNYCETELKAKCEPGYYGLDGYCGPCQCNTHENFNATCDPDGTMEKLSVAGRCFCKDGFYNSKNTCKPCNCLYAGSETQVCDKKTGHCRCKPKVIGKQCDRCPGAWEEIVTDCMEINNSCPKTYSDGIWWERIRPGRTRKARCPFNAVGNVTRYCHARNSWGPPIFFECTSQLFTFVQSMLTPILSGSKKLEKKVAVSMSFKLELAVSVPRLPSSPHSFYGKDIEIGYEALKLMIAYEGNQTGGFLVSSEDSHFIKNLMSSASRLFSTDVAVFWGTIQENHPGTAGLMKEIENFVSILARNLAYVKRRRSRRSVSLNPYHEATENIYFEIAPIVKDDNKTYILPKEQDEHSDEFPVWRKPSVNVMINKNLFLDNPSLRNVEQVNVGMVIYKTLGDLLPHENSKKYEMTVMSDVFTLTIPGVQEIYSDEEITIVYKDVQGLNDTDVSMKCMFWNYSLINTIGGGWSPRGCRTLRNPNSSDVTCYCNHLTSFAIVGVKYTEVIPRIYEVNFLTYLGLAITMCLLFVVFLVFMCLRQLKSNANSIHKNLALVAFVGWLVFCLTINRTYVGERNCRVFAILIHYFLTCAFSWLMVEALHMYRMILEPRDINYGQMMFYYFIGWGAPVVVVGVTTGLKPSGYETAEFCWINLRETEIIWTYTAPILAIIAGNIIMLLLALTSSCEKANIKNKKAKLARIRYRLAISFIFLVIIVVTLVSGLIAVSYDDTIFIYLFPGACVLEGVYMLLFYVIFNRKVRREAKNAYVRFSTDDKSYGLKPPRKIRKRFSEKESLINERYAHVFEAFNIDSTSSNESSDTMDGRRRAKKRIAGTDPTDYSTTVGESSDSSDDDSNTHGRRRKQTDTDSDSSDNSSGVDDYSGTPNENAPPGVEWKQATQKKLALSRTYASDGPMHSTPSESEASEKKWSKVGFTPKKMNTSELSAIPSESENNTPITGGKTKRVKGPKGPIRISNSSNTDSDTASQAKAPVSILKKKSQYDKNGHRLRAVRVKDNSSARKPLMSLNDSAAFNDSQV